MANQPIEIKTQTLWALIIVNVLSTICGALLKADHSHYSKWMLLLGIIFLFAAWIVIISDIFNAKIRNKPFWIISMLIFPSIAQIVYLAQRDKLFVKD
jgi:hypothetical protein